LRRIQNERDKVSAPRWWSFGRHFAHLRFRRGGRDSSGAIVKGASKRSSAMLPNIRVALQRAGADFKNVVRITAYVKDLADYPVYSKVRSEVFVRLAGERLGRVSDLLLGAKLEVDAVAVIGQG